MSVLNNLIGKRVGNNRIELISFLGEGSYGAVYRGILHRGGLRTPKHCAVKVQLNTTTLDPHHRLCLRRELELHERVSGGEGIVTLYETFIEDAYVFMIMKYCPDGDLWTAINKGRFFRNDALIKHIFSQVLDATEYCHSQSVYHRDIKPENIMLCNGGHKALLADFGLATNDQMSNELRTGSPWYMSPECWGKFPNFWEGSYYTAPNDVWSLGVLLINMACGRHAPWKFAHQGDPFFVDFLRQPNLLRLFVPLSPQVHDILARIFVPVPTARLSISELKVAIMGVKSFVVPSTRRNEYNDYQRAVWKATIGLAPPRQLPIQVITVYKPSLDALADAHRHATLVPQVEAPGSIQLDQDITIVNRQPQTYLEPRVESRCLPSLPRSSSSTSSVDSDGPITPEMPATIPDIEVLEIAGLSLDEPQGLRQQVVAVKQPPNTKHELVAPPNSWQDILNAIKAI